jgi:hypothetical protein
LTALNTLFIFYMYCVCYLLVPDEQLPGARGRRDNGAGAQRRVLVLRERHLRAQIPGIPMLNAIYLDVIHTMFSNLKLEII